MYNHTDFNKSRPLPVVPLDSCSSPLNIWKSPWIDLWFQTFPSHRRSYSTHKLDELWQHVALRLFAPAAFQNIQVPHGLYLPLLTWHFVFIDFKVNLLLKRISPEERLNDTQKIQFVWLKFKSLFLTLFTVFLSSSPNGSLLLLRAELQGAAIPEVLPPLWIQVPADWELLFAPADPTRLSAISHQSGLHLMRS